MKLAMRRRDNDSDSDTSITQPTNRGNKLKRNARHVREGRLDTTHGRSYKKRIDYAGYDRYILNENPLRFDDDGDLIDDDEYDPDDQDSSDHNANPWANTKLEELLAPLTSAADLADVPVPLTLGANSEAESRPNGPEGLSGSYGVDVAFTPIEDGGGPLTVQALKDDDIQIAIIYTATPSIAQEDLVVLDDPEGLFLASNVVPLASDNVDDEAAAIINEVNAKLTADGLRELNVQSVEDQSPASTIAKDWLEEQGLV